MAAPGDTLHVCPGVYEGGFTIEKAITLIGAGDGSNPYFNTVLDGIDTQRVLEITSGTVALHHLNIGYGYAGTENGGGLLNNAGFTTLTDCTVRYNAAAAGGGITTRNGGKVTLVRTRVTGNEARDNIGSGILNDNSTVELLDGSTVCDNYPPTDQCHGFTDTDGACQATCPEG